MFTPERQNAIKKIVRKHRRIHFTALERLVKASPATLRRDLADLERRGEVIRVHGGVLDPAYMRTEVPFNERIVRNGPEKRAIASVAADLVPPGATVLVDAGTTCLEAGKILLARNDVRVMTHSVALVQAGTLGNAPVICIGGELRKVSGALTGAAALAALNLIHADIALVGASGLDRDNGCSTTELTEAEMKKAFMGRAARKILLADLEKWQNPSTIQFAQWKDFNDWVTDKLPERQHATHLRSQGLKIHMPRHTRSGSQRSGSWTGYAI
ncbi:MAG TPA: DeoR/GlpR family DNA-binding transcription regulator [Verrucomicrobiae bacterium]|jgi:DeoR family fructose operon transcriptional repressor